MSQRISTVSAHCQCAAGPRGPLPRGAMRGALFSPAPPSQRSRAVTGNPSGANFHLANWSVSETQSGRASAGRAMRDTARPRRIATHPRSAHQGSRCRGTSACLCSPRFAPAVRAAEAGQGGGEKGCEGGNQACEFASHFLPPPRQTSRLDGRCRRYQLMNKEEAAMRNFSRKGGRKGRDGGLTLV